MAGGLGLAFFTRVQQTLASESGQRELALDVESVAPLDEPRMDRGDDVLRLARHRTTVSR